MIRGILMKKREPHETDVREGQGNGEARKKGGISWWLAQKEDKETEEKGMMRETKKREDVMRMRSKDFKTTRLYLSYAILACPFFSVPNKHQYILKPQF